MIKKEPTIKVGIVLPQDKKTSIEIVFPKPQLYTIDSGKVADVLKIEIQSNSVFVNNKLSNKIIIQPISDIDNASVLNINSVPAGRGFHWQKDILVQLPGKVIINNYNGYLFVINELPVEQYLPYVATSEMNADCPIALLEAQTITARSWLLAKAENKHSDLGIDVCNDDCCQRYQGVTVVPESSMQAILSTYGQVLLYDDKICDARYSKSCGGITEAYEKVWDGKPIPYLSSILDYPKPENRSSSTSAFCSPDYVKTDDIEKYLGKVDKSSSYYRWTIEYSQSELTSTINNKLNLNINNITRILILDRGFSGRIIKLKIYYENIVGKEKSITLNSEYDVRNALHNKFMYSSAITIDQSLDNSRNIKSIKINGAGWGHGVGLCQIGALGMALAGYSTEEILKHYFKGASLEKIY